MTKVAFRCGACGQVIATEESYRGKEVRCGGCGQSVRVPVQACAVHLPESSQTVLPWYVTEQPNKEREGSESVAVSSQAAAELTPLVETPSTAATSEERAAHDTSATVGDVAERDGTAGSTGAATPVELTPRSELITVSESTAPSGSPSVSVLPEGAMAWSGSSGEPAVLEKPRLRPPAAPGRRRLPISFLLLAVLIPTTVTFVAISVILFRMWLAEVARKERHPLEDLPDTLEGTVDIGGRPRTVINPVQRPPEGAAVRLGETKRFDGIEVTPLRVRWQRVTYARTEDGRTQVRSSDRMLTLYLRIRNVSDHILQPFEPIYNVAFREGRAVYTYLSVGDERFYGPLQDVALERLEDQTYGELWPASHHEGDDETPPKSAPPSELVTIIVAHQSPQRRKIEQALENLPTETALVWYVHLRKGRQDRIVKGKGYRLWLTTVVPVSFTVKDIEKEVP
ncbi:MAG: hypothetical protein RMJ19_01915 [Gemmatales bacterium]|nr:hypothetical protein [Gemmatales bacterium]MCS7159202.1 hypothetical protein [Gemmatales bacterium]MDW8174402.1 hypothetical protein [Gemmatales bacterium]MDW8222082.1 hypothetical protein [Gemmatales bacterium]